MTETPSAESAAVRVEDLVVDRGTVRAVDGVSFTVPEGAITALLGPNGAGKTSTVEHLEGYLPRSGGTVSVLGLDPTGRRSELASRVGLMLQNGGIPTAIRPAEVLSQYSSFFAHPMEPARLLDLVGLSERSRTPYRRLSGGEQQRLSLALALVGRPELLFLDEPTAGVDLEGRDLIRTLISELRSEGTTVLLTTHDLAEAEQLADRVLIMDHGRLLASGSPSELVAGFSGSDLRFRAAPGLDTAELARLASCTVSEVSPGQYVVDGSPTPEMVARVANWLAERGEQLSDLRADGGTLEDVFRTLTASARTDGRNGREDRP